MVTRTSPAPYQKYIACPVAFKFTGSFIMAERLEGIITHLSVTYYAICLLSLAQQGQFYSFLYGPEMNPKY
jgi:hypothetical protein